MSSSQQLRVGQGDIQHSSYHLHTCTLMGFSDKPVSQIGLSPISRLSIDKVVRGLIAKPFTPVPNVRYMSVSLEGMNEIFQHFRIHRDNKKLSFTNCKKQT